MENSQKNHHTVGLFRHPKHPHAKITVKTLTTILDIINDVVVEVVVVVVKEVVVVGSREVVVGKVEVVVGRVVVGVVVVQTGVTSGSTKSSSIQENNNILRIQSRNYRKEKDSNPLLSKIFTNPKKLPSTHAHYEGVFDI